MDSDRELANVIYAILVCMAKVRTRCEAEAVRHGVTYEQLQAQAIAGAIGEWLDQFADDGARGAAGAATGPMRHKRVHRAHARRDRGGQSGR